MPKHILRWGVILVMIIGIVLITNSLDLNSTTDGSSSGNSDTSVDIVDEVVFPHNEVVEVNIVIDESLLAELNENAMDEEYYEASIEYNGISVSNVAIRTKGNSSLQQVATSDSTRFSFKVDFNYYVSGQSLLGVKKLNLNNIFSDDTLMAEYLGYEMLESIDGDASRTSYVALSINGEYHGLYLAVEEVNESYLSNHFDDNNGALYKPDMGVGSDLVYFSDDIADYTDIIDKSDSKDDGSDFISFVKEIQNVLDGHGDLGTVMNVDSFLKYLAVSTATIHLDTYQSGMDHNYYLYSHDGVFEWISWDLNMIFNGYPGANLTETQAVDFLIDEPVIGSLNDYELIEAIFMNEEYVAIYHDYLEQLMNGYLEEEAFEAKVLETYEMIKTYASIDPTAFFDIDAVEESLFVTTDTNLSLLDFINARVDSMSQQLSGEIPSTNDGLGNNGTGTSGGMGGGKAGMEGEIPDEIKALFEGLTDEEIQAKLESMSREEVQELLGDVMPEGMEGPGGRERPEGMEAPPDGEMPEGMEAPADGEMPEGMEAPADGEMPEGMEAPADGQRPEGMEKGEIADESEAVVADNLVDNIGVIAGVSILMAGVIAFIKRR